MSPLSAGGFGKQLHASNARTSAAVVKKRNALGSSLPHEGCRPPHSSGQTKKPLPLNLGYRGLLRLYHRVGLVGMISTEVSKMAKLA